MEPLEKIPITIYHRIIGGHVHMRVFVFNGLVGNLIMTLAEFRRFKDGNFELNFKIEES